MPLFDEKHDEAIFTAAFHPSKAQFVLGFVSGTVTAYSYSQRESEIEVLWSTRRHKGSCRSVLYTQDGKNVISGGADMILKKADSSTGKVSAKARAPGVVTTACVNSKCYAVGDEEGSVSIYDLETMRRSQLYKNVFEDLINSIVPLTYENNYRFVAAALAQLVLIDTRKGIVQRSADQECEIIQGCSASAKRLAFGTSDGYLLIWDRQDFRDRLHRMRITDGGIESVIAGSTDNVVVVGTNEGLIYEIDVNQYRILRYRALEKPEEVSVLDWDYNYRLASCGLDHVVLWNENESSSVERNRKGHLAMLSRAAEKRNIYENSSDDNGPGTDSGKSESDCNASSLSDSFSSFGGIDTDCEEDKVRAG